MSKKHDLPSMPFYWGDWFKAMDLQSLPRETRCVWFEMLGRMWESNERGYLTIKGKPMSDFAKANALAFGSAIDEYLRHERLLEESGIFSRRKSDNAIYSRKMLNDIELSQKRALAGSKGGRKTWDFAISSAKANAKANCEYEYEDSNTTNTTNNIESNQTKSFEDIWNRYPNKDGKKQAFKHYKSSVRSKEDWININKALDNYLCCEKVQKGFIKNGSTWFNNWQDWIEVKEERMELI